MAIWLGDDTETFDEVAVESYVIREDLALGAPNQVVLATRVFPNASGAAGQVYVGTKMYLEENIQWRGPYTFDPATERGIPIRAKGRWHSFKYVFPDEESGSLEGYDFEIHQRGRGR